MFERPVNYPCAIADQTDEGMQAALDWVLERKKDNEEVTLWVVQKRILGINEFLKDLSRYEGRGLKIVVKDPIYQANGPVLSMYPDVKNLSYSTGAKGITALAVVQWADKLDTWAHEVNAEVIHTFESESDRFPTYREEEPELTPEIIRGLKYITSAINHNNTIAASGYDKDSTIRELLQLKDNGHELPPNRMAEWAIAHGWLRDNPKELINWVRKINSGVRPRISRY